MGTDEMKKMTKKQKLERKILKLQKQYEDLYYTDSSVKPMLTERNIETLLYNLNVGVKFNEITKTVYIENYDKSDENKNNICSSLKNFTSFLEDEIIRQDFQSKSYETLYRKLDSISYKNSYNPVKEYLLLNYRKNKDKISKNFNNIDSFIDILKVRQSDKEITKMLVKKWLISCVASQLDDNFISHGILTLAGEQGIGKTSFFRMLIPKLLLIENKKKDGYFKEGYRLDLRNKDSLIEFLQYWIVELGELDSTAKNQISELKAFITKKYDTFRSPFGRTNQDYKRITVACASIDKEKFLRDDVNRRFWVVDCIDIDYKKSIDIDLVWAELTQLFFNGEICYLTKDEIKILNEHNRNFNMSTETDSIIESCFDWNSKERYLLSSNDIYLILSCNYKNLTTNKIGIALKKMNIEYIEKSARKKFYKMPKPFNIIVKDEVLTNWKYEQVNIETNKISLIIDKKIINNAIKYIKSINCIEHLNILENAFKSTFDSFDFDEIMKYIELKRDSLKSNQGATLSKIIESNVNKNKSTAKINTVDNNKYEFIFDLNKVNLNMTYPTSTVCKIYFDKNKNLVVPDCKEELNFNMINNFYKDLNLKPGMSYEVVSNILSNKKESRNDSIL